MKESDYILATNLARIYAARGILREVTNLTAAHKKKLQRTHVLLSQIEFDLADRVGKTGAKA